MAIQCDHCGKILPGDTIRYCPGCGKRVASSHPLKKSLSEDPPAWIKQLETSLTNNRSKIPLRELNARVWDEEETIAVTLPKNEVDTDEVEQDPVDDLPTNPHMVSSSPIISTPSQSHSSNSGIDRDEEDIAEALPTNPHMASLPQNTPKKDVLSFPGVDFGNGVTSHDQLEDIETRPYRTQPFRQTSSGSMPVHPFARPKKNNRKRIALVFGFLLCLLFGGVIAWVFVEQPFTVPEITKTTQNFHNASFGLILQYPQNWTVDVDKQHGTVSFYDDNHTDQVNITVVLADNQSLNQFLTKTVNSLAMTGQKKQADLSFAGTTWQRIQGSVQRSGANYTASLLITMHRGRYYTILQLAPTSTYPLEEQLVFSKMRSSFQF